MSLKNSHVIERFEEFGHRVPVYRLLLALWCFPGQKKGSGDYSRGGCGHTGAKLLLIQGGERQCWRQEARTFVTDSFD